MEWSELTMFDRMLHMVDQREPCVNYLWPRNAGQVMRSARKFVMTDDATAKVRDAIVAYPELLALNGQFAIPPFETMWIEFDNRVMIDSDILTNGNPYDTASADVRIGYLFHAGRVYSVSEAADHRPFVTPFTCQLHRPMRFHEQDAMAEFFNVSRIGIDPFLWGHTLHQYVDGDVAPMLRHQHSVAWTSRDIGDAVSRQRLYLGASGELRSLLAILLMLNQPGRWVSRDVPRQRGMIRGKSKPYFGHSVIDINLDRARPVTLLGGEPRSGRSVRWHEVRGHFCHNRIARTNGCAHTWVEMVSRRWECSCGAKRWWRQYPDGRGSAQVGYVDQIRRIVADTV